MIEKPEFSRPLSIEALGNGPYGVEIEADALEREALARRFALPGIAKLQARAEFVRTGDIIRVQGIVRAAVTQSCVVTGDAVDAKLEESFTLSFQPPPGSSLEEEEVELNEDELDVVFYEGGTVDIGEAVAQTLSLALDPYPRAPGCEARLKQAGVKSEEEAGPFAALAALRGTRSDSGS